VLVERRLPRVTARPFNSAPDRIIAPGGRHERGETLVEILIAIVVIGIVSSASFFAISVGATSSKSHRDLVTADEVLRNFAEAAKQAARLQCMNPTGQTLTITYPGGTSPFPVAATGPAPALGLPKCPSSLTTVSEVDITATLPSGVKKVLNIDVRAP
jgi:prepilin-type N-terminal cleavage/methylation domain-containing protein